MDGLLFSGMRWNFFNIKQDGRCGKYRITNNPFQHDQGDLFESHYNKSRESKT